MPTIHAQEIPQIRVRKMTRLKERHRVMLATELDVDAATPEEAGQKALLWLDAALAELHVPENDTDDVRVHRRALRLNNAMVLALQLLDLEDRGDDALARVQALRADVEAELKHRAA